MDTELIEKQLAEAHAARSNEAVRDHENRCHQVADESIIQLKKVETGIPIFSDDFGLLAHRDSLLLAAGQTGGGKTQLCMQSGAHGVCGGRRVLIISNEVTAPIYRGYICRILAQQRRSSLYDAILFSEREGLLKIEDLRSSGGRSGCFDALVPFTMEKIQKERPDLVIVDQISCATRSAFGGNVKLETYQRLTHISRGFAAEIAANRSLPPIIMVQQALDGRPKESKPGEIDMKSSLRGAKDTFDDATHGIFISRRREESGDVTTITIAKQRYYMKHTPVTDWVMNESRILIPVAKAIASRRLL